MATAAGDTSMKKLDDITECCICLKAFTDPRILPCIHTMCLKCLQELGAKSEKNPGDNLPCPICRKEFVIPEEGVCGLQKNFFMENLMEVMAMLRLRGTAIPCVICKPDDDTEADRVPNATMRCLKCREDMCTRCSKVHEQQKATKDHQVIKINSDVNEEEIRIMFPIMNCSKHSRKLLDYYCTDCKKIVCVSCFVESHKSHDCKDVATLEEEFRQAIEKNSAKIFSYAGEMLSKKRNLERKKDEFILKISSRKDEVRKRNQELKDLIEEHTTKLLDDLEAIKNTHLKEMQTSIEEVDRRVTVMKSFDAYCTELKSKGSASDICGGVDELHRRADELEKDHEQFLGLPYPSVEVTFQATDLAGFLQTAINIVGKTEDVTTNFERCVIVAGLADDTSTTMEVNKVNLHRPNEIPDLPPIPVAVTKGLPVAVACDDMMYVIGLGSTGDEVWRFEPTPGVWVKRENLAQTRSRHAVAVLGHSLYVCGGFVESDGSVLDSIESHDTLTNIWITAGQLKHAVQSPSCVVYDGSIYVFGGLDKDGGVLDHVQVYNDVQKTCTLLSMPIPKPDKFMVAALYETFAILLSRQTCLVFNFVTQSWQERERFKTDDDEFGMIYENGRIFVMGGQKKSEADANGQITSQYRDDIRSVPAESIINDTVVDWKIQVKLQRPALVQAYAGVAFKAQ